MSSFLLYPDRIKSLYFEENAEIQAFLLPTESSFNCIFAVACEEKTGKIHTFAVELIYRHWQNIFRQVHIKAVFIAIIMSALAGVIYREMRDQTSSQ